MRSCVLLPFKLLKKQLKDRIRISTESSGRQRRRDMNSEEDFCLTARAALHDRGAPLPFMGR